MRWGILGFWFCGVVCPNVGSVLGRFCSWERTRGHACKCAVEQIAKGWIQCGQVLVHGLLNLFSFDSKHLPVVLGNTEGVEKNSVHLGSLWLASNLQLFDVTLVGFSEFVDLLSCHRVVPSDRAGQRL